MSRWYEQNPLDHPVIGRLESLGKNAYGYLRVACPVCKDPCNPRHILMHIGQAATRERKAGGGRHEDFRIAHTEADPRARRWVRK